jgi:hypothetical protein
VPRPPFIAGDIDLEMLRERERDLVPSGAASLDNGDRDRVGLSLDPNPNALSRCFIFSQKDFDHP